MATDTLMFGEQTFFVVLAFNNQMNAINDLDYDIVFDFSKKELSTSLDSFDFVFDASKGTAIVENTREQKQILVFQCFMLFCLCFYLKKVI